MKQQKHRKEMVAGNLSEFAVSGKFSCRRCPACIELACPLPLTEYKNALEVLGDDGKGWDDEDDVEQTTDAMGLFREFLAHVPQVSDR